MVLKITDGLLCKLCDCGAVVVVYLLSGGVSYQFGVIDSLLSVQKKLLIEVENIPKSSANNMRATLACLFTCVSIAHVL